VSGVWEVEAVRYGTYPSLKSRLFLQYATYGEADAEQALDYYLYVLRSEERVVVVDTGFAAATGEGRGRMCLRDPAAVLAPLDAEALILTHLHYDHIGNVEAAGDAPVLVPATELAFWRSETARHAPFWAHTDPAGLEAVGAAEAAGRVRSFAGSTTLLDGITAFEVGGHSPGQIVLLVRTADRPVLLCSDAVHLYEELERRRPFAVADDLRRMYAGYDLVDALVAGLGAVAVPGHEPLVMDRFPEGRLGVRLG
jgi:glyoxylase-like metal-dependent hydrolase (beta-lactamase superfamily II)